MIRLRDTRYASTSAFLENAERISSYYGFVPLEEVARTPDPKRSVPTMEEIESAVSFARREERALSSVARKMPFLARHEHRALFFWRTVPGGGTIPSVSFELHVVGHASALAEALLIAVANAIAEEAGISGRTLSLNNIGGLESSGRFMRDVSGFLRKHLDSITPSLRPRAGHDPVGALVQLIERGHPALARMPQATEYLSEEERRRFWELLEYMETSGIAYELSGHVLGSRDVWSHALYEVSARDAETGARIPFASGGRYDPLASRFAKQPEQAAMITLSCEMRGSTQLKASERAEPGIFFAHIGIESRRRALPAIEQLRRAGIPIHHSLTYERLGDQMIAANALRVPVILILGHKEAMENTILVRTVASNSQEAVPLADLPGYLRRRRLAPAAAA